MSTLNLPAILSLPTQWHDSGSLHSSVLKALAQLPPATHSAETGTGKSTLIFSHISKNHTVFTKDDRGDGNSLDHVRNSPMLRRESVRFVIGATQRTLPQYHFPQPLDFAFIDGPHGYPFPELEYFFLYPNLKPGGWLIVDDTEIPTIARLIDFLKEDAMFRLDRVVRTTAFFQRTDAPLFPPTEDGWWTQGYNKKHFPSIRHSPLKAWPRLLVPRPLKAFLKRQLR